MLVMNCKHVFNQELWQIGLKKCLCLRNIVQNRLLPKYIHTVFLPQYIKWCPQEKLSRPFYPLQSSSNVWERLHPSNNRLFVQGLIDGSLPASQDNGFSYSPAEQKAILNEFNTASYEALCSYGFRSTVALALKECRPFWRLVEVLKVPGIGYGSLNKACRRVYEVVQQKKNPVQPPMTLLWAQEFKDVVSVCVVPGYVAYAHLALCPAQHETARVNASLGDGTDTENEESTPLSDKLLRGRASNTDSVEVVGLDLLPVETADPKLHPHKLLQKVRAAMYEVPQCSVYAMPVSGVLLNTGLSVTEAAITLQRAQIMGAVQGLLAQRCSVQASEIRYIRDAVVHDVFSLRVGKDIVTNLELLMKLLNGSSTSTRQQDSLAVPRLTVPPYVKEHFTSLGGSQQRTVAPALYTGLVLCSVVAATRRQND